MSKHKALRILGMLVFLSGGTTWAQVTTGTISGTVKDSTGGVLPGVNLAILNEETGNSRTVATNASGHYSVLGLNPGDYRVTASLEGFQTEVWRGIVLSVGREAVVDLVLKVGAMTEMVEVTGEAPLVDSTSASLGSLVDERTIRDLPLNGRSYDQLALIQPGVMPASPGPLGGNPYNYGTGKRFSVRGQRDVSNSFLLDGTNINDQGNGTPGGAGGTNLGVDAIREFKIFTSMFKAEYGHSSGSVVTAVTRSGTNFLHGTVFEYLRNSALDARNFFDTGSSPPPFRRNQFGGVLGGPIKRDKTFFFGGYEGLRQGLGTTLIATVPTALARQGILPTGTVPVNPAVKPYLELYPLPNGRDFGDGTGEFLSSPTIVTNENYVIGRVDHQLNNNTNIFGRYTFDSDIVDAPQNMPNLVNVTATRRQYTTLQANSILGARALNNFRTAYNRTRSISEPITVPAAPAAMSFIPGQPLGNIQVGAAISGGARAISFLGPSTGNGLSLWVFNIFQWADDFSYVIGKHILKTGVDIQRMQENVTSQRVRGTYTFTTFTNFLAGTASNLQASAPLGVQVEYGWRQSLFAAYVQDDYTVNSRLTLNLGFRWETTTDPNEANGRSSMLPSLSATNTVISDRFFSIRKKNFEPRVGLAWRLNASGKTVLRAGGGIYHTQIFPWLYFGNTKIPPFGGIYSANNPPFPNGYLVLGPGAGATALLTQAPLNKTPVNDQYNLSIQQEIARNTVVEVAYSGSRAAHLAVGREANPASSTVLANGQLFYPVGSPRVNPAWAGIRYFETAANSVYNSATVTLRKQSSSGFQGQIFYTYSKSMDDASNMSGADSVRSPALILVPNDRRRNWALSDFDSRHNVVANFSYPAPFRAGSKALGAVVNGWTFNGIATFSAGMPFTPTLAAAVSRDLSSVLTERPNLNPGASQNPTSGVSAGCPGFAAGTPVGNANNWYDPCSFSLPPAGTYGNLARNTIIGPGIKNLDLALEKSFKLHENANALFRFEMFNVLNHTNFGLPNQTPLTTAGAANPAAGRITYTITSSRQLQMALRINF